MRNILYGALFFLSVAACFSIAHGEPLPAEAGPLRAVVHVRDGDTIVVGREGTTDQEVIRVLELNTPEKRSICPTPAQRAREQALALRATNRTRQLTADGVHVVRPPHGRNLDRYGRSLRRVYIADGRLLSAVLISERLGMAYDGKGRAALMYCR